MAILIENLPVPYTDEGLLELRVFNGQPQARYNDGYGGCSKWQNMIDVPPHGRLIDADAFLEYGGYGKDIIDDMPVIIQAEGSEA